jgi:hypothetical protein
MAVGKSRDIGLTIIQRTIRSYIEAGASNTQAFSYEKVTRIRTTRSTPQNAYPLERQRRTVFGVNALLSNGTPP